MHSENFFPVGSWCLVFLSASAGDSKTSGSVNKITVLFCFVLFSKMGMKPDWLEYTPGGSPLVLVHLVRGTRPQKNVNAIGASSKTTKMVRSCKV